MGKREALLRIVRLLRHDAVEPERAGTRMGAPGLPEPPAYAAPAQILAHDVEAEEGEALVIIDHRDHRRRRAVQFRDQKALRIHRAEAGIVAQAGIQPSFRRPLHRKPDFRLLQDANLWKLGHWMTPRIGNRRSP